MQLKYQFYIAISLCILSLQRLKAQVGYGTTSPDQSAVVDMASKNKGLLIPRITLSGTNLTTPITTPIANSLLIFNTATAGSFPNSVTPGYYYFSTNANGWVKLSDDPTWNIAGNTSTIPYTNSIGTTDDQDLIFKINNIRSGLLNSSSRNTSLGLSSLNANASINTGTDNVAVGYAVLANNTIGSFNTVGGYGALTSNTTGEGNTAIGLASLEQNTIGKYNNAIGVQTLTKNISGNGNIAMLPLALAANKDGEFNVSIGYYSLEENISGNNNIAIGQGGLKSNLTGNNNVSVGISSLDKNNTDDNVAIGSYALSSNLSKNNTAMGYFSLITSQIGNNNTAYGESALGSVGDSSSLDNSNNTGLGTSSGSIFFTGSNNTAFGVNTGFDSNNGDNTANNQLNIANSIFGVNLTGDVISPKGNIGINTTYTLPPNSTLQIEGSISNTITTIGHAGFITNKHHTILVVGNVLLPNPIVSKGRIYILVNDTDDNAITNTIYTDGGSFRDSGNTLPTLNISKTSTRRFVIQSDGAQWVVISRS